MRTENTRTKEENFGLREFFGALAGMELGAVTLPTLTMPRALYHLPGALNTAYTVLARYPRLGPNLKTMIGIALPFAGGALPPLIWVSSTMIGVAWGCYNGTERKELQTPFDMEQFLRENFDDKLMNELMPKIRDFEPKPLQPGETPFDVPLGRAARGLVGGLVSLFIGSPLLMATVAIRLPQLWHKALRIAIDGDVNLLLRIVFIVLAMSITALSPSLIHAGSVSFGLGAGVVRGYKEGIWSTLRGAGSDAHTLHKLLSKHLN